MNNLPREKLKEIIAQYGHSVYGDPKRCKALLLDFCGQHRKEISVLVLAIGERVPIDLLASSNSMPSAGLLARLTKRLQDRVSLTEDSARWAVESWGLALGVISEVDTTSASVSSLSSTSQNPPQSTEFKAQPSSSQAESSYSNPPSIPSSDLQENTFNQPRHLSPPIIDQKISLKTSTANAIKYAGFWRRLAAYLFDLIIVVLIGGFSGAVLGILFAMLDMSVEDMEVLFDFIGFAINWLYFTLMESSSKQATIGKMALGIYVTDLNENRISFGKANGRYFGKFFSGLILGIGFLMIVFTDKKQGLHDVMAGCIVIKK